MSASPASQASLVLPAGCTTVGAGTGQQVVVCQPSQDTWVDKLIPSLPALVVAIAALVLSLRTFRYNREKDERARRTSIVDDFWLRKVVSPVSIEPFLKETTDLCTGLPDASTPVADITTFWIAQTATSAKLTVAFMAFTLVDQSLSDEATSRLEEIDEIVATYCGLLQVAIHAGTKAPDRDQAIQEIQRICMSVYAAIKAQQVTAA